MSDRQAKLTDAFELFVSLFDDAAALGDAKELRHLEAAATALAESAKLRREAVAERLGGDISCALAGEDAAEAKLREFV
jgi:hypothetical protein